MDAILVASASSEKQDSGKEGKEENTLETILPEAALAQSDESQATTTPVEGPAATTSLVTEEVRRFNKDETRFEGRISKDVWLLYARAAGSLWYWSFLLVVLILGALSPVWENGWLKCVRHLRGKFF